MKKVSTYHLSVEATTKNLLKVREFIAHHAKSEGFSSQTVSDLCLATDEALTNIIKHAYKNDASKKISIELEFDDEKVCISLKDKGESFNRNTYKKPDIRDQIKKKKRGGMGVYLIHQLMDKVQYVTDSAVNEIRLCKNKS